MVWGREESIPECLSDCPSTSSGNGCKLMGASGHPSAGRVPTEERGRCIETRIRDVGVSIRGLLRRLLLNQRRQFLARYSRYEAAAGETCSGSGSRATTGAASRSESTTAVMPAASMHANTM